MEMIPIKDAQWEVFIYCDFNLFYWEAINNGKIGFCETLTSISDYKTKTGAISNWKKFAELNGITKYTIEVEE